MVTDNLVPGNCLVEPGGLIRLLIINGAGPDIGAGAGGDEFAVNDVNLPSQLVILSGVACITKGNAEVERRFFVHRIDRLNCSIKHVGRCEYDRRIGRRIARRAICLAPFDIEGVETGIPYQQYGRRLW